MLGRIGSYATLYYVGDTTDAARQKFYGDINQKLNDLTTRLIFFELELNRIDDKDLEKSLQVERSPITARGSTTSGRSGRISSRTASRSCSTKSR